MMKKFNFKRIIHLLVILTSACIILPVVLSYDTAHNINAKDKLSIENGAINLATHVTENPVLSLDGEWLVFDDLYFDGATASVSGIEPSSSVVFPIHTLTEAQGTKTYEIKIKYDFDNDYFENCKLSIPFAVDSINVFMNGNRVQPYVPLISTNGTRTQETMYDINEFLEKDENYQELLISVNPNGDETSLFRRGVKYGTTEEVMMLERVLNSTESMSVGMMLVIMAIGYIYIWQVPTYSSFTFINIFDTLIMLHIFFNMGSSAQTFTNSVIPGNFGDMSIVSLDYLFLFFAGAAGNILGDTLYNQNKLINKIYLLPLTIAYAVLGFYFMIFPTHFDNFGVPVLMVLLLLTVIGIIKKYIALRKFESVNWYMKFHFVKTMYLGVVIFFDVITLLNPKRDYMLILAGYSVFLFIHLIVRAFAYKMQYSEVEKLNIHLEATVLERTKQLVEKNKMLERLTVIDPLTGVFNRLHFENILIDSIENYKSFKEINSLYLCVFDLDNFKSINDTFGHTVGDEQLIELSKVATKEVPEDVVISRIGGEEFTLLFKNYNDDKVLQVVENLRLKIEELSKKEGRTTSSFGIAKAKYTDDRKSLFINADNCLYQSKKNGRNRIHYIYDEDVIQL